MKGYEGLRFMAEYGDIAGTAVTSQKIQESDSSTTGWSDIEGAEIPVAANDDNKIKIVEVANIRKRYARGVIDRGTANAAVRTALYEKFNPAYAPVQQHADVEAVIVTP